MARATAGRSSPAPKRLGTLLLVPVNDATAAQVVRAELHNHTVIGEDPDVVHPHLPADVSEYLVPVVQLHPEEGIRQRLDHCALDLDGAVFLGHILRASILLSRLTPTWRVVGLFALVGIAP